ncbi:MAG: amino acid adenylation domain-containing protein [Leptolyngbya sp. IPPAS B-1204]
MNNRGIQTETKQDQQQDTAMATIDQFLNHLYSLDVQLWLETDQATNAVRLRCNAPEEILTPALSDELQQRKSEIIAFLHQTALAQTAPPPLIPQSRPADLPLSFAQQRLWFLEQLQPDSAVYHIPIAVRLTGTLNITQFEQALRVLLQRHESLRTNFQLINGQPAQAIRSAISLSLPIVDLMNLAVINQNVTEKIIKTLTLQAAQTPFDLVSDPLLRLILLRLSADQHILLLTLHHLITDGWSMEIFMRELAALYAGGTPLPELPIQYADFALWQRQWLQGKPLAVQLDYWKQQLGGDLPILQLPLDFPRSRMQTSRGGVVHFSLTADLSTRLKALAHQAGCTLFMTLLAAYKLLLYRYTGQTDLIVGSPIANRNRAEVEGLIGFFVNTLVLRTDLSGNPSFRELLQRVRQVTWAAYDHQDLPFEKLVEELHPERDLSYNPLFQTKFRLENAPTERLQVPGLTLDLLPQIAPVAKLDLSVDLYETSNGIVGSFEYNRGLFAPRTIERMVNHFCTLLDRIVDSPDQPISNLELFTATEKQRILVDWNQTQINYAQETFFHQLFESQAERTSDAIALIFNDQQITYRELNHRSNQLAHYLQNLGVGPEVVVGLCIDRTPEMIIGLLAILKAGGAYLPLDPTYPPERLAFMVTDAQIAIMLTQTAILHSILQPVAWLNSIPTVIPLDQDWPMIARSPAHNPVCSLHPLNLAYLIYTSGSTGVPKGVWISHAGLVNLTEDKIRVCDVRAGDTVLQFFSFSFDASIPEIIMALGSGAKLCLAPAAQLLPGTDLLHLLHQQSITHITLTPSALSALPTADLPALRIVLVGGEAPAAELIQRWSIGRRFINAYGPTETTVNASMVPCGNRESVGEFDNELNSEFFSEPDNESTSDPLLPTLRPSANKQLYILDRHLHPVPIGVIGELHIGGLGLARGYRHRPDLTAEKFIPNPFAHLCQAEDNRLYKTGDLACYLPDGRIKLLGRIDNQVKIRGFRIEPGEIAALLDQHPAVQTSLVTVRTIDADPRLVAYVVLDPAALPAPDSHPTPTELRRFLKTKLPDYLVPAAIVPLPALPLTPNGKVDLQALPAPNPNRTAPLLQPRTDLEATLLQLFAQVLEVESLSIDDDFFDLGGHSLLATRLIAQLQTTLQLDISVADLFQAPTVADLAHHLTTQQTRQRLQATPNADEREEIEL